MIPSKAQTDQRFIDMARMQYAQLYGVKIGFKGFKKQLEDDDFTDAQAA